jgi:glutaconate CoA-transferase subunit B
LGTRPEVLPLSIGDGELCDTALTTVPVPEIFRYWLQGGRITIGFLGGAQVDRFGNLNITVIGNYTAPKVRLPGSGGATEIATGAGQIFIVMRHGPRSFVKQLDFLTTLGHGRSGRERRELGIRTKGPTLLVTDLCVMRPDAETGEMVVDSLHPGISREQVCRNTSWDVRFADNVVKTEPPSAEELAVLRELHARTARAHGTSGGSE